MAEMQLLKKLLSILRKHFLSTINFLFKITTTIKTNTEIPYTSLVINLSFICYFLFFGKISSFTNTFISSIKESTAVAEVPS